MLRLIWGFLFSFGNSFAIIALRKRELIALLKFCSCCHGTVTVVRLFLAVSWAGLQYGALVTYYFEQRHYSIEQHPCVFHSAWVL